MCGFILGNFIFGSTLELNIELLSLNTDFFIIESVFRITLKYL